MEKKDYEKYWENKLIKYTNSSKSTALPKSSLTIIEEWGLPTFKGWIFNFDCLKSKLKSITIDEKNYFVFGNNFETSIAFDKEGKIWSFMPDDQEDENLLVNSSLQNFATFLCFFHEYWKKVRALEKEEGKIMQLITETKNKMLSHDPEALSNEEYFWSTIIEEMEYGFI